MSYAKDQLERYRKFYEITGKTIFKEETEACTETENAMYERLLRQGKPLPAGISQDEDDPEYFVKTVRKSYEVSDMTDTEVAEYLKYKELTLLREQNNHLERIRRLLYCGAFGFNVLMVLAFFGLAIEAADKGASEAVIIYFLFACVFGGISYLLFRTRKE